MPFPILPGVLQQSGLPVLLASFNVGWSGGNLATNFPSFDRINFQNGGLGLVAPLTTITAPAGTSFGIFSFKTRSGGVASSFYENGIALNGSEWTSNPNHGGDYNTGLASAIVPMSAGDTIGAFWNPNGGANSDSGSTSFIGYFYA